MSNLDSIPVYYLIVGKRPRLSNALIGIGAPDHYTGDPCHTTRHAGPHRAVREVEVA